MVDDLAAHNPLPGLLSDALFVKARDEEALGGQEDCAAAMRLYQQLAAGHGTPATAAVFRLNASPCATGLKNPLASFGPFQLENIQWSADGVSLLWRATDSVVLDYTVFVHALDSQGKVVGQQDGQPTSGALPTSTWRPGEIVPDAHDFALPPGAAQIEIGAYVLQTGQRLQLADGHDAFTLPLQAGGSAGIAGALS